MLLCPFTAYITDKLVAGREFLESFSTAKYFSRADLESVADINVGLPFKDQQFSTVLMMDLHYIDARALLVEIVRITTPGRDSI